MNREPQQYMLFYFTSTPSSAGNSTSQEGKFGAECGLPVAAHWANLLTCETLDTPVTQEARVKGGGAQPACVKSRF